ncbi:MAG: polysaccharide deacetylase family protein [Bacteroidaceae bacterium]|nr:polysaccharide deacetylase family protein [Bacteroidaceae bacterium]
MIIEQPSWFLRGFLPRATWRMNRTAKAVYLTFDDGPIPEATPFILETLKEYGAKATFFMVGDNARKYPELFERVRSEGHRIGNHTFNHLSGIRHTTRDYIANVKKANEIFRTNLFRPPHGWLRYPQYAYVSHYYTVVMWDVITRDYSKLMTAEDVLNNVKTYTRNGSIITFHDSLKSIDKLKTALPASLQWLKEQGYEFKVFE